MRPPLRISRPVKMFSETVSSGNSWGSWYTVAIPSAMASPVEWIATGRPSNSIVPVSAASTPEMILIMVDLPAPFSPTSAWTRPARMVMSPLRMARTAPKRFETPVRCSRGAAAAGAGASGAGGGGGGAAGAGSGAWVAGAGSVEAACALDCGAREGWSTVIVSELPVERARAGGPARRGTAGPTAWSSVVVLVHVVLGDDQRRPEEQRLRRGVVLDRGQVGADVVRLRELLALGELAAGPCGEVPQVLHVPQDRRRRRAVLQVRLHRLRGAEADGEDLPDLVRVLHRLGNAGR